MTAIIFGATPPLPKKCLTCKQPKWQWNEHSREWDCLNCANVNPCVTQHGLGPEGKTCKDCNHLYRDRHHDQTYLKCELRTLTRGAGSDHRAKWPACARFEPVELDPRAKALSQAKKCRCQRADAHECAYARGLTRRVECDCECHSH